MVEKSTKFYDQKNHGVFAMFKVNNLGFCPSLKNKCITYSCIEGQTWTCANALWHSKTTHVKDKIDSCTFVVLVISEHTKFPIAWVIVFTL